MGKTKTTVIPFPRGCAAAREELGLQGACCEYCHAERVEIQLTSVFLGFEYRKIPYMVCCTLWSDYVTNGVRGKVPRRRPKGLMGLLRKINAEEVDQ